MMMLLGHMDASLLHVDGRVTFFFLIYDYMPFGK